MAVLSQILQHKIVAIIRGANPNDVLRITKALYDGGIRVVEITFNSPDALKVVKDLSAKMGKEMLIGMGTVLDTATTKKAIKAGARFIISPSLNSEVIRVTRKNGAVSIPGAFTPTEIITAYEHGADIIKVFPASLGAGYIKDIRGPFPHIPLMPTGGISIDNVGEYFKAGAAAVGIGSALVNTKKEMTKEYLMEMTETAIQFVQAVAKL